MIQYREVLLMDYTVNGMPLMLWNYDLIRRAESWKPGQTGKGNAIVVALQHKSVFANIVYELVRFVP
jgi:hypothetical protein